MSKKIRFSLFVTGAVCLASPVFLITSGMGFLYAAGLMILHYCGFAATLMAISAD